MTERPLRMMLLGGEPSLWVEISSAISSRSTQILVPRDISVDSLRSIAGDIDVVVVALESDDPDPCASLRVLRDAGLQRATVVLANSDNQRVAAEALEIGVGGYLRKNTRADDLALAVLHISKGGVYLDAPAAAVAHGMLGTDEKRTPGLLGAARALASALEFKDTYTGGHAERVTALAIRLAGAALIPGALPSEALEAAFLLHDVGKIGIPESILSKPGGLTDTERRVLQTHPILGERIIAPLGFPDVVAQVVRSHHERWDGAGYPDGLHGDNIPAAARIFTIADVLDAMTSLRPYRRPIPFEEAVGEVIRNAGTQFDPQLAALAEEVFLDEPVELLGFDL